MFLPAPLAEPEPPRSIVPDVLAAACAVLASTLFALGSSPVAHRVLLPGALIACAVLLARRRRSRRLAEQEARCRGLCLERGRLRFVLARRGIDAEVLLPIDRPFGVTLFADRGRTRLLLAITTFERSLYVAAKLPGDATRAYAHLLARASTVADDEPALDAVGPDGAPLEVAPRDLLRLYERLAEIDPGAPSRCLLSDASGASVALDGAALTVGDRTFDLDAPLEWRSIVFQEPMTSWARGPSDGGSSPSWPSAIVLYQATLIRQGAKDAVLVSTLSPETGWGPLPSTTPRPADTPELERALTRDLRLMQAVSDTPPSDGTRTAIERIFMVPLRAALDRAPRPSRSRLPSSAPLR